MGGTIHLAVGRSYPESGGRNDSAVHWDMIKDLRAQGDLYLDGKQVLRTGVLFGKPPKGMQRRSNAKIFAGRSTRVGG
jgi:leucyl aminopeptidase (aminopeptidase T)